MAVAVEGIGDKIEWLKGDQGVKSSRCHTRDLVGVQRQSFQVDQSVENLFVDFFHHIFRQNTIEKEQFYSIISELLLNESRNLLRDINEFSCFKRKYDLNRPFW